MNLRGLLRACAAVAAAVLATSAPAWAQRNTLWIGYRLPSNPDLEAIARDVEAKARTERTAALTICANSPNRDDCERQAEITFRGRLLSSRDITFGLYVDNFSNGPRWMLNLARESALDPDFDQEFGQLQPGRVHSLGLHFDSGACRFARDSNDSPVDAEDTQLAATVCELVRRQENATGMLSRLISQNIPPAARQVSFLLDRGADPNVRAGNVTALTRAIDRGFIDAARLLAGHGAEINIKDNDGATPLVRAAGKGQADVVTLLLERQADVNARTRDGFTALIEAARHGHADVARLLLERPGVDINARTNTGHTALSWVVDEYPWGYVHGEDETDSEAALAAQAFRRKQAGYATVLQLLLDHHADVNARDNNGYTALIQAGDRPVDVARILIERGADVNARTNDGFTSLLNASDFDPGVVKLLIDRGADVNATTNDGETALIRAASAGAIETVRLLLAAGAATDAANSKGLNALKTAVATGHPEVADLLRQRGAR